MANATHKNVWHNGKIVSAQIFKFKGMEFSVYGEFLAHPESTYYFYRGGNFIVTLIEAMDYEMVIELFCENYQELLAV